MKPLALGLIGYGGFGRFCLDVYAAMPDLRVVAVADVDAARRQEAAERYGARPYADAADLLAAPDVDVVAICTPPYTHTLLSLAAARAGKHIFCEKPLGRRRAGDRRAVCGRGHGGLGLWRALSRYRPRPRGTETAGRQAGRVSPLDSRRNGGPYRRHPRPTAQARGHCY